MIVNLRQKRNFYLLKQIGAFFKRCYQDLFHRGTVNRLFHDSQHLMKYFRHNYPQLKKDPIGNIFCTSCELCEKVCPTQAIKIKKANLVDFPSSLKAGEAPLHFHLDVEKCIKCHLCADVCLVDALVLDGKFTDQKVDLVSISQAEKVLPDSENQD